MANYKEYRVLVKASDEGEFLDAVRPFLGTIAIFEPVIEKILVLGKTRKDEFRLTISRMTYWQNQRKKRYTKYRIGTLPKRLVEDDRNSKGTFRIRGSLLILQAEKPKKK